MQADQASNGEYEFLQYHKFKAVDNDRLMSWKARSGRIRVGISEITFQNTEKYLKDVVLPGGQSVLVTDTDFKLGPKT